MNASVHAFGMLKHVYTTRCSHLSISMCAKRLAYGSIESGFQGTQSPGRGCRGGGPPLPPAAPRGAATAAAGAVTPAAGTEATAGTPQPGGTMSVAYQNDIATLDPAIGYDWNNWPMEKMVFDALMDYDQGTTLVPQLAAEM